MLSKKPQQKSKFDVQVKTKFPDFGSISNAYQKLKNDSVEATSQKRREMKVFTIRKSVTPHHIRVPSK